MPMLGAPNYHKGRRKLWTTVLMFDTHLIGFSEGLPIAICCIGILPLLLCSVVQSCSGYAGSSYCDGFVLQAGNWQSIVQLKQGTDSFHHKFQQWMKSCKVLKQEKNLMGKQICELETQLKMADPSM